MFCPNCGKELNDDAAFCGGCGNPINGDAKEPADQHSSQQVSANESTVVQPSAAATAKATVSAVGSAAKASPKLFIGIGVALVVVIVGIALAVLLMTGGFTGGQTAATFKQAFESQEAYLNGVPSSTYAKESPYKLTSCNVSDIQKKSEDWVTAKIDAVVENDTYKVVAQYAADYYNYPNVSRSSKSNIGSYQFEQLSREVEAKAGVSRDDKNGLSNVEGVMSEDGTTCQVDTDEQFDFWFANSALKRTYYYSMSDMGWTFEDNVDDHHVTYKDIDGAYVAKSGDMLSFTSFTISDLNPESGSFGIKIALSEKPGSYSTRLAAEATLQATIDPQAAGKYGQKDGYTYSFEAKGSSTGGNGAASFTGYLTVGEDGAKTIQVSSGKIDTTTTHSIGDPSPGSFGFSGVLFKQ